MLSSLRVLVVEDDPLVAHHVTDLLTEADAVVLGPFATLGEARQVVKTERAPDAALLDLNLSDGLATPLLEALLARRIPTVIYTGGAVPDVIRRKHPELIALSKPVRPARLIGELRRVMGKLAV
jgi:DNA-binding response OmpR family regulator